MEQDEQTNNIGIFLENEQREDVIDKELYKLLAFSSLSWVETKVWNRIPSTFFVTKVRNDNKSYIFHYKGKKYKFELFSERDIQKYDKEVLKNIEKRLENSFRTIKLACSLPIINAKLIVGSTLYSSFELVISFLENGEEKVIDYNKNIVMSKKDYYELFKMKEYNVLDKYDLYRIYTLCAELDNNELLTYCLLFSKEIFKDIGKNFSEFTDKYDQNGINMRNKILFGEEFDCLFFQEEDERNEKYYQINKELNDFTLNPNSNFEHIKYLNDGYKYKKIGFGSFEFNLISNIVKDKEKEILLSLKRFGHCHKNTWRLAGGLLGGNDKSFIYIVGGKIKYNDKDYIYHSWLELDNGKKSIVMDYNFNIIMDRKKYYKLKGALPICKTKYEELDNYLQTINQYPFTFGYGFINYFGSEIAQNLKKNECILKREK